VPSISAGLYVLEAGADDPQGPHRQDEIYYVIAGRAQIRVDGEDRADGEEDQVEAEERLFELAFLVDDVSRYRDRCQCFLLACLTPRQSLRQFHTAGGPLSRDRRPI